jgi:hypothetical protein
MTILKGATFRKTFADGFREGYRSRMGSTAAIPAIPAHAIPAAAAHDAGVGAYLSGIARGIAAALRKKPVRETPSD